jgi:hypothetical protein
MIFCFSTNLNVFANYGFDYMMQDAENMARASNDDLATCEMMVPNREAANRKRKTQYTCKCRFVRVIGFYRA